MARCSLPTPADRGAAINDDVIGFAGNLRTTDKGGPYNISLLSQQANEIKGGCHLQVHE